MLLRLAETFLGCFVQQLVGLAQPVGDLLLERRVGKRLFGENYHEVRYEDLISCPQEVLELYFDSKETPDERKAELLRHAAAIFREVAEPIVPQIVTARIDRTDLAGRG